MIAFWPKEFIRTMLNFVVSLEMYLTFVIKTDTCVVLFWLLQGQLAVGTMVSFIGYTFTLTFAVSCVCCFPKDLNFPTHAIFFAQE